MAEHGILLKLEYRIIVIEVRTLRSIFGQHREQQLLRVWLNSMGITKEFFMQFERILSRKFYCCCCLLRCFAISTIHNSISDMKRDIWFDFMQPLFLFPSILHFFSDHTHKKFHHSRWAVFFFFRSGWQSFNDSRVSWSELILRLFHCLYFFFSL